MRKGGGLLGIGLLVGAVLGACAGGADTHDAAVADSAGNGGAGNDGAGHGGAGNGGVGGSIAGADAGDGGQGSNAGKDAQSMLDAAAEDSGAIVCPSGQHWDGTACVAGEGCEDDCSDHGACTAGKCTCQAGYAGAACDACALGWTRSADGETCKRDAGAFEDILIEQWGYGDLNEVHTLAIGSADEVVFAGYTDGAIDGHTPGGMEDLVVGGRNPAAQSADGWQRQWGTATSDIAGGVVVDGDGNVFVAGVTSGDLDGSNAGYADAVLSKWNADHALQWTTQWGSAGNEYVTDLARDDDGNLFVTGWTTGGVQGTNAGAFDVFLSKLSASGDVAWSVQVGTAVDDRGIQVAVDAAGNAYVTGATAGKLDVDPWVDGSDVFLLKASPAGDIEWIRQWGTGLNDIGLDVGCLAGGDLVVSGQTDSMLPGATGSGGAFVARLDASGDVLWTQQFGPTQQDGVDRLVVGADGLLYLAGSTGSDFVPNGGRGARDVFVQARDLGGAVVWTQQFGTSKTDQVFAIAAAADGTVYVGGTTAGTFSGQTKTGTFDNFLITIVP